MSGIAPSYFWDLETLFELTNNSVTNFSAQVGNHLLSIFRSERIVMHFSEPALDVALEIAPNVETCEEVEERPAKKTRGVNLKWRQIAVHDNVDIALSLYSPTKMIERDLIKGKVVRTKTVVYNYSCGKKTCGCKKQYRLITVQCASEVIEEETVGDHINHDQYERNNGRGLSFSQSRIIEDALTDNNIKPQKVFDYFVTVAERGILREGKWPKSH